MNDIYKKIAEEYKVLARIKKGKINLLKSVIFEIRKMIDDIEDESTFTPLYNKYCYEVGNIPKDEFDENLLEVLRKDGFFQI